VPCWSLRALLIRSHSSLTGLLTIIPDRHAQPSDSSTPPAKTRLRPDIVAYPYTGTSYSERQPGAHAACRRSLFYVPHIIPLHCSSSAIESDLETKFLIDLLVARCLSLLLALLTALFAYCSLTCVIFHYELIVMFPIPYCLLADQEREELARASTKNIPQKRGRGRARQPNDTLVPAKSPHTRMSLPSRTSNTAAAAQPLHLKIPNDAPLPAAVLHPKRHVEHYMELVQRNAVGFYQIGATLWVGAVVASDGGGGCVRELLGPMLRSSPCCRRGSMPGRTLVATSERGTRENIRARRHAATLGCTAHVCTPSCSRTPPARSTPSSTIAVSAAICSVRKPSLLWTQRIHRASCSRIEIRRSTLLPGAFFPATRRWMRATHRQPRGRLWGVWATRLPTALGGAACTPLASANTSS
jgi:hypothetical protein